MAGYHALLIATRLCVMATRRYHRYVKGGLSTTGTATMERYVFKWFFPNAQLMRRRKGRGSCDSGLSISSSSPHHLWMKSRMWILTLLQTGPQTILGLPRELLSLPRCKSCLITRYGSAIFSQSHHFTVAGGTFNNVTKNYTTTPIVPSGRIPPHFLRGH